MYRESSEFVRLWLEGHVSVTVRVWFQECVLLLWKVHFLGSPRIFIKVRLKFWVCDWKDMSVWLKVWFRECVLLLWKVHFFLWVQGCLWKCKNMSLVLGLHLYKQNENVYKSLVCVNAKMYTDICKGLCECMWIFYKFLSLCECKNAYLQTLFVQIQKCMLIFTKLVCVSARMHISICTGLCECRNSCWCL